MGRKSRAKHHKCPGNCGRMVEQAKLACLADWLRLPLFIRNKINEAYYSGDTQRHIRALGAALVWYEQNPREVTFTQDR